MWPWASESLQSSTAHGDGGREPNTMRQTKMKPNSPHRKTKKKRKKERKEREGFSPAMRSPWVRSAFQPIYSISLGYQGGNSVAFVSGLNCCRSIHPKQACLSASWMFNTWRLFSCANAGNSVQGTQGETQATRDKQGYWALACWAPAESYQLPLCPRKESRTEERACQYTDMSEYSNAA